MNTKEIALLLTFLNDYLEQLKNNSCNDFEFPKNWSQEDVENFNRRFLKENKFDYEVLQALALLLIQDMKKLTIYEEGFKVIEALKKGHLIS